jgi:hypothetical protein
MIKSGSKKTSLHFFFFFFSVIPTLYQQKTETFGALEWGKMILSLPQEETAEKSIFGMWDRRN